MARIKNKDPELDVIQPVLLLAERMSDFAVDKKKIQDFESTGIHLVCWLYNILNP